MCEHSACLKSESIEHFIMNFICLFLFVLWHIADIEIFFILNLGTSSYAGAAVCCAAGSYAPIGASSCSSCPVGEPWGCIDSCGSFIACVKFYFLTNVLSFFYIFCFSPFRVYFCLNCSSFLIYTLTYILHILFFDMFFFIAARHITFIRFSFSFS